EEKIPLFGELKLSKSQTFMTIRDHVAHHRGQMVIYLRLKGIKPPQYVGW
nr:DinB family protein [Candidatus Aminicenantes bacterium]NIM80034.1 DinB family protein [Candidatus Aminicenantes bacterium]NIO82289.1 DinB family protein [Candidatus Aminicenantes bacterium]NIQ68157.1 DinB family protein [Candidatus Aminicenantes bacterium]